MPYGVLVTRGLVYYPCPAEGQHRLLDKGNLGALCESKSHILLNASIPLKIEKGSLRER